MGLFGFGAYPLSRLQEGNLNALIVRLSEATDTHLARLAVNGGSVSA
jgi:hypothetical protein